MTCINGVSLSMVAQLTITVQYLLAMLDAITALNGVTLTDLCLVTEEKLDFYELVQFGISSYTYPSTPVLSTHLSLKAFQVS